MLPNYVYHPIWFYIITISFALIAGPLGVYLSKHEGLGQLQMLLFLLSMCLPCITALFMIFTSHNKIMKDDFCNRLVLFKFNPIYLLMILILMPAVICLATWISIHFGYSVDQFSLNKDFGILKGWAILGITIPLILAPLVEEIGWRGYGVDSLRAHFNLFKTSLLFGLLWGIWHLPGFFTEGFYHNQIWHQNKLYALNFFISIFAISFFMNWVYYKTNRSIPALVLFHAMLNFSAMALQTEQFTKCIVTVLLIMVSAILVLYDRRFFFEVPMTHTNVRKY